MGIDLLKSTTEDQMDMMRELGSHHGSGGSTAKLPKMEFYGSGAGDSVNDDNVAAAVMPPIIFDCARPPFTLFNHPCSMEFSINAPAHHRNPLPTASVLPSSSGGENWSGGNEFPSQKQGSMAAKREMIFRIAAMRPIYVDPESVRPPRRRNVKISKDPQSVAARHRRERISERIRILQRLVPGGTKLDTASMLDEAVHYVKFLKSQLQSLKRAAVDRSLVAAAVGDGTGVGNPATMTRGSCIPVMKGYLHHHPGVQNVHKQQQ